MHEGTWITCVLSVIPAGFISRPVAHVDVIIGNQFRALKRRLSRAATHVNRHPSHRRSTPLISEQGENILLTHR